MQSSPGSLLDPRTQDSGAPIACSLLWGSISSSVIEEGSMLQTSFLVCVKIGMPCRHDRRQATQSAMRTTRMRDDPRLLSVSQLILREVATIRELVGDT